MAQEELARQYRRVNLYMTPVAIMIIASGLLFAELAFGARIAGWVLLGYSVVANTLSARFADAYPQLVGSYRVVSNYVVNLILLVLLYPAWPHVWLLILLMSLASAVYGRKGESIAVSLSLVSTLIAAEWGLGDHSPQSWATIAVWCVSILAITRFVNVVGSRRRDEDAASEAPAETDSTEDPETE